MVHMQPLYCLLTGNMHKRGSLSYSLAFFKATKRIRESLNCSHAITASQSHTLQRVVEGERGTKIMHVVLSCILHCTCISTIST